MADSIPLESVSQDELFQRAVSGEQGSLAELFSRFSDRLRMFVALRIDSRIQRRVDASDVLQEAYLVISKRFHDYAENPAVPPYIWFRRITGQVLADTHRRHLGAKMRSVGMEISIHRGALPHASSVSLARFLIGQFTSPSVNVRRAELQVQLQEALNSLPDIDREIVALRHFEELRNSEVAKLLEIDKSTATKRYIRAISRLKSVLESSPSFGGPFNID